MPIPIPIQYPRFQILIASPANTVVVPTAMPLVLPRYKTVMGNDIGDWGQRRVEKETMK